MKIAFLVLINFWGGLPFFGQELPVDVSQIRKSECGWMGGACNLGCSIGWTMAASSQREILKNGKIFKFSIDKAEDWQPQTYWQSSEKQPNSSIFFSFSKKDFQETEILDSATGKGIGWNYRKDIGLKGIRFINGASQKKSEWKKHGRIKRCVVKINGKAKMQLIFLDNTCCQELEFSKKIKLNPGNKVELKILETYPGTDDSYPCVSEMELMGGH